MSLLFTLVYFLVAMLVLIFVHEMGHFLVARSCGVKVLRFSFGFGKVLASCRDRRGTEYAWAMFPLGGYIKMLDETECEVPAHERHLAFNNQPLWARIAIVIAGPLFNLIFAFLALWLVLVIGIKSLAPIISEVKHGSIAELAGLKPNEEVLELNSKKIGSWRDFQYAFIPLLGTHESISVVTKSLSTNKEKTRSLILKQWRLEGQNPDLLDSLGIVPFVPRIPPVVGEVMADSPAQIAGLLRGDIILSVDNKPFDDWMILVDYVRLHPDQHLSLKIRRQGLPMLVPILTGHTDNHGQVEGYAGLRSQPIEWPRQWLRLQKEAPLHAIGIAFEQTVGLTGATFSLVGRLIMGEVPLTSMSGPVGIADGAAQSARHGLSYFLSFLALMSISLGVLNLLPIPMLDGGHLLYYLIELIIRRPLSEGFKSKGVALGLLILMMMMVIALTNDLARLGI